VFSNDDIICDMCLASPCSLANVLHGNIADGDTHTHGADAGRIGASVYQHAAIAWSASAF
jgi:hypothetical protein